MSTTMRAFSRAMLALAVLLGVGAGVLGVAAPAQAASFGAYGVTVARTGGFAGVHEQYSVSFATDHALVPSLLSTANGRSYQSLSAAYLAGLPGADRFTYTVTVSYLDGTSKVVSTVDGAEAPAVLWQVIDLTMQISRDVTASVGS